MSTYPVGSVITARFAFTLRPLTQTELAAYVAGNGLPSGTGVDPTTVFFDYQQPEMPSVTLTGSSITKDAVGAYHAQVAVTSGGLWRYRGRGVDGSGNPVACTPDQTFTGTRSF